MDTRFHCVYLLTSLNPQCSGAYYVGYTVNPIRRLRQHNGELVNGAHRTRSRGRPWLLLLCVSGFGEDRIALKFEWCWQNPTKSTRLKAHMSLLRGVYRLQYAVGVLFLLLRVAPFAQLHLTLHVFDSDRFEQVTAALHTLAPSISRVSETPLLRLETTTYEEFQERYIDEVVGGDVSSPANECGAYFLSASARTLSQRQGDGSMWSGRYTCEEDVIRQHVREKELMNSGRFPCSLCTLPLRTPYFLRCCQAPFCGLRAHIACLAMWFTHCVIKHQRQLEAEASTLTTAPEAVGDSRAANTHGGGGGATPWPCFNSCEQTLNYPKEAGSFMTSQPTPFFPMSQGNDETAVAPTVDLTIVPRQPCACPLCDEPLHWGALVYDLKRRVTIDRRWAEQQRRSVVEAIVAERLNRIQRSPNKRRPGRERREAVAVGKRRRELAIASMESSQQSLVRAPTYQLSPGHAIGAPESAFSGVEFGTPPLNQGMSQTSFIPNDVSDLTQPSSENANFFNADGNAAVAECHRSLVPTEFNVSDWLED
ncbi:GIY YIG catalytic domain [Trypanosoma vivax]|uniref:Structure-specific endonuclease subunit SLX1 homolog n=1 Tax=Trypanosoma vivax (strain Y486) TaxID=1055687 RepID=G0TSE0_TRYVY|nr:hypothetical protein TRVL_01444 [Trypanosoma vivax]KAH8605720.1 GIY YIG catalytic domain [Trypanosoma vivax]CCC46866.1 conserved hypothetical protein [Trypanosoma vivax Y486]